MDQKADLNHATILVVEDEALVSAMISDALLDHGFHVHAVANGSDALRYLLSGLPADVLFTDINLPGEIDGTMLAQRARDMRPGLPVVFASGRWALLERLRAVPRAACLPKPYSPERACMVVEGLVATRH
jgi:CheY-like chemotaxis protein